jgi:hypothetical protein
LLGIEQRREIEVGGRMMAADDHGAGERTDAHFIDAGQQARFSHASGSK